MRRALHRQLLCTLLAAAFAATAIEAAAAPIAPAPLGSSTGQANVTPGPLENVKIEQHLGDTLPLDARFKDDDGREVRLGDFFGEGKKPVLLVMAYYECPMLCTLVLNGMVKAIRPMSLTAGEDFEVVAISIDPKDTPALAHEKKLVYLESYGRKGDSSSFHFLTGDEAAIKTVADAIGFEYRFMPETGEYAHAAAVYVATPLGQLSRYFFGVEFSSRDLRLAFVEAADGKIGSLVDQLMLFCYRYDPAAGKYSAEALAVVRLGGVITAMSLFGFIGISRWRESHSTRS